MRHILALALLVACSGRSGTSSTGPSPAPECRAVEADRAECLGKAGYQYVADPMANCAGGTPKEDEPDGPPPPCECLSAEDLSERHEQCKNMPASSES